MDWIKRNLLFVIVAVVALLLLVGAGFYTWTGYQQNDEAFTKLNQAYEDLKRLTQDPFIGGSGGKVDNVKVAQEQQKEIRDFLAKSSRQFQRIPSIPAGEKVTRDEYASVLRLTIDQMQREATNNSVVLPPKYSFSFEAQRQRTDFDNIPRLTGQLGEVKAICEVLNKAKVNAIDAIRRERVSRDDDSGPAGDYISTHSTTNDLAILSPYEISFRSFSPELAAVLAGFANSPNGMIIKSINVEAAPQQAPDIYSQPQPEAPRYVQPVAPPPPQQIPGGGARGEGDRYADRYKINPVAPPPPVQYAPVAAAPKAMAPLLNEKQLRVTLLVMVVKLLPPKK